MELPQYPPTDTEPLWRVTTFGEHTNPVGSRYWWVNRGRQPHGEIAIQASLRGRIHFHDQTAHEVNPGQIVMFVHGEATAYGSRAPLTEPYTCRWLNLRGAGLNEHLDLIRKRHGPVLNTDLEHPIHSAMIELLELTRNHLANQGPNLLDMAAAVHAFVLRLIEIGDRQRLGEQSPVDRAVDHLLRHPFSGHSVKEMAAEHGVTREHLSRVFAQRVGRSAHEYLREVRTRRAVRMLRDTALPLRAIAEQSGFAHVRTLARQVREATGQTTAALRRRRR
jgi:AraC-like DNA-binding protein